VVIANSHYTAEQIRSRYKTQPKRIEVIYRGVDGALFDPEQIEHHRVAALRSAWGIGQDERVVLQAARLTSWKGQGVLIEAAQAGDTQKRKAYEASLASAIRTAGLENRVRLVGHVDDMPAAFLTAHVAVVASTEPEAFGRTATEAQVMGTPIIATDIGAPPETVLGRPYITEDAATGWLVPPGNAARLSDALVAVLALPPEERARMGARARAHVLQTFSLKAMKEQTLRIYDRLLGTNLATGE
jgi:glycosyltransferase involved in cell wall biosynthesis